jgi:3'-phosphoadenosine 5'-phosphosulfate sulfotransferase (PAPS reductase)/FAD synthetase
VIRNKAPRAPKTPKSRPALTRSPYTRAVEDAAYATLEEQRQPSAGWMLGHPVETERTVDPLAREIRGYVKREKKDARPRGEAPHLGDDVQMLPLPDYDRILIGFSGGKDSIACLLTIEDRLRALGVDPRSKIELWHHNVDGGPNDPAVFDWPCTDAYVRGVADALGYPLYFQWREGGIIREVLKRDGLPERIRFELPGGGIGTNKAGKAEPKTRRMWPALAADLRTRWCSSLVKIDVMKGAIANDPRFARANVLIVTGERREESGARARYANAFEHSSTNQKRRVDQYRAVLEWPETLVWDRIRQAGIVPHPCYFLGFSRCSCMTCIFLKPDDWATVREIAPARFNQIAGVERDIGQTIRHKTTTRGLAAAERAIRARGLVGVELEQALLAAREAHTQYEPLPVGTVADAGTPHSASDSAAWRRAAMDPHYAGPFRVQPDRWVTPPGAFGESGGPT